MFEIVFVSIATGEVQFAVTNVAVIRYIHPREVGWVYAGGRVSSSPFPATERLEINRVS